MNSPGKAYEEKDEKRSLPRWLPITLLTMTTVALTVPVVLLWRQKQALGPHTSPSLGRRQGVTPPPARRRPLSGTSTVRAETNPRPVVSSNTSRSSSVPTPPPPRRVSSRTSVLDTTPASGRRVTLAHRIPKKPSSTVVTFFDGPLLSLGAFGLATAAVGVTTVLGVWGVQTLLGVNNIDEFAARVRQLLQSHMPVLSRRIYRSARVDDGPLPSAPREGSHHDQPEDWNWDAAEDRLRVAFDRGGVGAWAVTAMRELEAEEGVERRKRGL